MTRHGMVKTPASGASPPATYTRAFMVTIAADRLPRAGRRAGETARTRNEAAYPHPSPHSLAAVAPSQT
jgi:hypothetical protein